MNSYEDNINIENMFNNRLDNEEWIKLDGILTQKHLGDYFNKELNIHVDFKVDRFNNSDNIVLEVQQVSGNNWIDELDSTVWLGYVKLSTGLVYFWPMYKIKAFTKTDVYKYRKEYKTFTNTTFKNFKLSELPKSTFIKTVNPEIFKEYIKKDVLGDSKYINIRRIINA